MKILRCKVCKGEVDIVGDIFAVFKKIRCTKCGFNNVDIKEPEIFIVKRK